MAVVSISEAARLTGKSRKTIQRYVADGRISMSHRDAGRDGIDTSELIRVFGEMSHSVPALSHGTESQHVAVDVSPNVAVLETRIQALQAEIAARDALLEAKDKHIASLDTALRLLEGPKTEKAPAPTPVPARKPAEPVKRRWWQAR